MKTQIAQRITSPLYWAPIMRGIQKKGEIAFMIRSLTSLGDIAPAFAKAPDCVDIEPPPQRARHVADTRTEGAFE